VIRFGMALIVLVAAAAGCRGPSPLGAGDARRGRVARVGAALLPDGAVRWGVTGRRGVGAWAWPDGRIEVSGALVDRLDDEELAAALAHELGHLLDDGHLPGRHALDGGAGDAERRADRLGCGLLRRHAIPGAAMPRMLAKVAAATRDPSGALAMRIAAASAACAVTSPAP
jgi:hypothetical protein